MGNQFEMKRMSEPQVAKNSASCIPCSEFDSKSSRSFLQMHFTIILLRFWSLCTSILFHHWVETQILSLSEQEQSFTNCTAAMLNNTFASFSHHSVTIQRSDFRKPQTAFSLVFYFTSKTLQPRQPLPSALVHYISLRSGLEI